MIGEVKAGAIIEIGPDVDESIDVIISWDDGINTGTATVIVNLDGDAQAPSSSGGLPGFTAILGLVAMLGAAIAVRGKVE
jgi:PGF-CTERM protein